MDLQKWAYLAELDIQEKTEWAHKILRQLALGETLYQCECGTLPDSQRTTEVFPGAEELETCRKCLVFLKPLDRVEEEEILEYAKELLRKYT